MTLAQRHIVLGAISLIFLTTGILKLLGSPLEVVQFIHWGFPIWFMYLTGVINIAAAIGLQTKRFFSLSVSVLIILLSLAILSILIHHDGLAALLQPLVLSAVMLFTFNKNWNNFRK